MPLHDRQRCAATWRNRFDHLISERKRAERQGFCGACARPAIEALRGHADALYVAGDAILNANRIGINTLAVGAKLPTMYIQKEFVDAGGLISYGPNFPDLFRRTAELVDKILRGAKPADMPVDQPTKFDLVINLTTARALGLMIPETFLSRADEVIE